MNYTSNNTIFWHRNLSLFSFTFTTANLFPYVKSICRQGLWNDWKRRTWNCLGYTRI